MSTPGSAPKGQDGASPVEPRVLEASGIDGGSAGAATMPPSIEALSDAAQPISRRLFRAGMLTYAFNASTLAVNLVTGILIARALGAEGRGELAAIMAVTQMVGWLFAMGCQKAVAYRQAGHPEDGGRLISSWSLLLLPLGIIGVAAGQLLLPVLFSAQSPEAIDLARLYMLTVLSGLMVELGIGMVLGSERYFAFNLLRVAHPAGIGVLLVALWLTDALSVGRVLAAHAIVGVTLSVVLAVWVTRTYGLARPSPALMRSSGWYGLRAHGTHVSGLANTRLDLVVMPAFLAASSVGLYSVATNLSFIVVTLAGALHVLVLPAAVRSGGQTGRTVVLALSVTLLLACVLALGVAPVADLGIRLLYGDAFAGSVLPFLILLPGSVLYAGSGVLESGLYALNRPFTAAVAQGFGLIVTMVGLLLFLRSGDIIAAAIVTTVSYTVAFLAALLLFRREADLSWVELLPKRGEFAVRRGKSAPGRAQA